MKKLFIIFMACCMLTFSACTTRDVADVMGDIAQGVVIFDELREDWKGFKEIVDKDGMDAATAIEAGNRLWDSAVKLRPLTYKQMKKHPELIELYSKARITLAGVLGKGEVPELTIEEIDKFLATQ